MDITGRSRKPTVYHVYNMPMRAHFLDGAE